MSEVNGPDLTLVESFAALADERHVGRAAERLGLAPTVLSQRLVRLERQLGVRLAVRSTRAVTLTAAGEVFGRAALATITAVEESVAAARAAARSEQQEIRLGWTADSEIVMRPVVRAARLADHGVALSYHGLVEQSLLAGLLDKYLDLAFLFDPYDGLDPALVPEPLVCVESGIAIRSDHPLAGRAAVTVADLVDEPLALFPRAAAADIHDVLVAACRPPGAPPRVRVVPLDTHGAQGAMMDSVLADGGFCPTTRYVFARAHPPGLSYLPLAPKIVTSMTAVYRRDDSATVAPVVDVIRRTVTARPAELPTGCWPCPDPPG